MAKEYISKIFVTVDIVVFREKNTQKEILLIQRKNEPFKNQWALPGGFVDNDEDLETAAKRELQEETCVVASNLQQVKAYGNHIVTHVVIWFPWHISQRLIVIQTQLPPMMPRHYSGLLWKTSPI